MHRTTTTTAALLVMALSALSGCVTVQHPPVPGAAAPSPPSAPRPRADAEPQVVQAPAREALEMVPDTRERAATTLRQRHRAAPSAVPDGHAPAYRSHPQHPRPRPAQPDPHRRVPDAGAEIRRNTDVCALGRKYGGWRDDSPEAVACRQVYGHR
ncbi:hypothetical protein [Streptomyces sp. YKOK-I1]